MKTQMVRLAVVIQLLALTFAVNAQHTVTINTPNGGYISISGDSTRYSFKAKIANYEGRFKDAAELELKSIEKGESSDEKEDYYDVASYFALAGDKEKGFEYLKKSLDMGYNDIGYLQTDKKLKVLRDDKSWNKQLKKHLKAYYKVNNRELSDMFAEDQAPRLPGAGTIDWKKLNPADSIRRLRVLEMLEKGKVTSAHDYYKASMIMHHGQLAEDYEKAHELALKAIEFEDRHRMSPWLAAATKDRYLLKVGKPQWFGTQGMEFLQKTMKMGINPDKIDTTAVSPDQRKAWNAPSIKTIESYLKNYEEEQKLKKKETEN